MGMDELGSLVLLMARLNQTALGSNAAKNALEIDRLPAVLASIYSARKSLERRDSTLKALQGASGAIGREFESLRARQ